MELTVLRKTGYKGTTIYIMNYGTMFQYLFAWNKEVYQNHVFIKTRLWSRIKSWFGKPLYSKEEMEYGEDVLMQGAVESVDALSLKKTISSGSISKIRKLRSKILPRKEVPFNK